MSKDDVFFVCLGRQENSIRWMTNGIKIDTIVMTKWWNFGIYCFVIVVISGFVYCILHVCGGDPLPALRTCLPAAYSPGDPKKWKGCLIVILTPKELYKVLEYKDYAPLPILKK